MSTVTIDVELPEDWTQFSLPVALSNRLTKLLDEQDRNGRLEDAERQEAEALCELVDMLALLRLRAERATRK